MTEAEWLACDRPDRILASLFARVRVRGGAAADERFRRFAIGCCRRVAEVLEFGDAHALDCLEVYADTGPHEALQKARQAHRPAGTAASRGLSTVDRTDPVARNRAGARLMATSAVWCCTKSRPTQAAVAYHEAAVARAHLNVAAGTPPPPGHRPSEWLPPDPAELAAQAALLRDIFGNPFRPITFASAWRTDTAVALARQMYESRDFGAMPILADALQDAGCDQLLTLDHCRDTALTHVRGCWVVDHLLNQSRR